MKGEIWWFAKPGAIDPAEVIYDLDQRGLVYRQPTVGGDGIKVLNDDGSSREVSVDEVALLFQTPEPPTALLWLGSDINIGFGPDDSPLHPWSFSLDGLNWAEGQRVVFAVVGCALGTPGTLGVVADHQLPDRYEDWIPYFEHRRGIPYAADLLLRTGTGREHDHTLHLPEWSWLARRPY